MSQDTPFARMAACGVVPVIAIDSPEAALPLADAMLAGGLPVLEITFRTDAAAEVIQTLTRERPELLVGAGTVLSIENLERAKECGASFGVAPGLNAAVVRRAAEIGLPFVPGVATPSEVEAAMGLGCTVLKLFPSGALGGVKYLQALAGPYQHTGVRFLPTGGVTTDNLAEYLALGVVAAVGGTWLAQREHLVAGNWPEITARCEAAVEIVGQTRRNG
jgi:2-dehydro-3-deoxyphosphogluconate aldolase / (4S)-4-hydroxy-2-oxoglutarate aldolase